MSTLLHLDSSFRTVDSRSRKLTAYFTEKWRAENPDGSVTYRDLVADPVPHLDAAAFYANLVPAEERTPEQAAARAYTDIILGEVLAADTIVVGVPLYNFGPPTTFKAWFDRIVVPGVTMGALGDKQFVIITASGGGYGAGTPREGWDHRVPWLQHALSTLGVEKPVFLGAELTLARESPAMIPLDLGHAEDASYAEAVAAIDQLLTS